MPPHHIALAVLVAVSWGANFVVIDLGLGDLPPTLFVALRFAVVLLPAIFLVPRPQVPWRDVLLVGLFMSPGQFALLYTALAVGMPAGLASLVLQAQVGLTVVIAALALRERPSRAQVVGGSSVRWASRWWRSGARPRRPPSGWCSSSRPRRRGRSATSSRAVPRAAVGTRCPSTGSGSPARTGFGAGLSMTVWSALVVPLPLFALSVAVEGPDAVSRALTHLTTAAVLSTLYTAWLASLVGYGNWNTLLARHPAAAVVPFTMLVPVVGLTTAWLVQGEAPNAWEATGGALLLLGVAVTTGVLDPRRRRGGRGPGPGPVEAAEPPTAAGPAPTPAR